MAQPKRMVAWISASEAVKLISIADMKRKAAVQRHGESDWNGAAAVLSGRCFEL